MAFLSIIRRWHLREHVPIREISQRTGVSRNTIRRYLRSERVEPKFRVPDRPSKLDPYAEKLSAWLRLEAGHASRSARSGNCMPISSGLALRGLTTVWRPLPARGRRSADCRELRRTAHGGIRICCAVAVFGVIKAAYDFEQIVRRPHLRFVRAGGKYVTARLAGIANLTSGRFAMIEDGFGFHLVPWQPVLEKRLDQYISGVRRDDGRIEWEFTRKRQIGLGL